MHQWIPINLRGACQKESRPLVFGQSQRLMGAQRPDLQGLNRQLEIVNRAGGRCEMPHVIHRNIEKNELRHILLNEPEVSVASEMRDVIHAPGYEIINPDYFMTALKQIVGQMGAEKA